MNTKLISFLQDNSRQIIESWLGEAELPPPQPDAEEGTISYEAIESLFNSVIRFLKHEEGSVAPVFFDEMDRSFTCYPGRSACIELMRSGTSAFSEIFRIYSLDEFSVGELHEYEGITQLTLEQVLSRQIQDCCRACQKSFCPFETHRSGQLYVGSN